MHKSAARARRRKRAPARRTYHPGPAIADEAGLRRGVRSPARHGPRPCREACGDRRPAAVTPSRAGLCRPRRHHRLAAGVGRERKRHFRPARGAPRSARCRSGRRGDRGRTTRMRAVDAQDPRAARARRGRRGGRARSCRPRRARRGGSACEARRGERRRPLDRRHLSAFLPRPSRRLSGRRPRPAGGGEARPRPEDASGRRPARADRRALAAVARRRGAHALGLLSGRQEAFGDGPRRSLPAKSSRRRRDWSPTNERCPGWTPHSGERRPRRTRLSSSCMDTARTETT